MEINYNAVWVIANSLEKENVGYQGVEGLGYLRPVPHGGSAEVSETDPKHV